MLARWLDLVCHHGNCDVTRRHDNRLWSRSAMASRRNPFIFRYKQQQHQCQNASINPHPGLNPFTFTFQRSSSFDNDQQRRSAVGNDNRHQNGCQTPGERRRPRTVDAGRSSPFWATIVWDGQAFIFITIQLWNPKLNPDLLNWRLAHWLPLMWEMFTLILVSPCSWLSWDRRTGETNQCSGLLIQQHNK